MAEIRAEMVANVWKVVDSPHPVVVRSMLDACSKGEVTEACESLKQLWTKGYSAQDIISTMFRVTKTLEVPEALRLEYIKEIGFTHMRILEGITTYLQLAGCVARLCGIQVK